MRLVQSGGVLSRVKPSETAISLHGLISAEWSHSQPRSTGLPSAVDTVQARPPSRLRASSATTRSLAAARRRQATMPAAPAPTITTSKSGPPAIEIPVLSLHHDTDDGSGKCRKLHSRDSARGDSAALPRLGAGRCPREKAGRSRHDRRYRGRAGAHAPPQNSDP